MVFNHCWNLGKKVNMTVCVTVAFTMFGRARRNNLKANSLVYNFYYIFPLCRVKSKPVSTVIRPKVWGYTTYTF